MINIYVCIDDTDALANEGQKLEALVESLNKTCIRYKMKNSAEIAKVKAYNTNGIQSEI